NRFFLGVALAEIGALVGFVGFITTGKPALYPLGVTFTAIGFVRVAPTASHLDRDQRSLSERGIRLNLLAALNTSPRASGRE
ncbi:MAG TPA: hypothetical protein VID93_07330, partial [Acidimicrobiales bacterium]